MLIGIGFSFNVLRPDCLPRVVICQNKIAARTKEVYELTHRCTATGLKRCPKSILNTVQHTVMHLSKPIYISYVMCQPADVEGIRKKLIDESLEQIDLVAKAMAASHSRAILYFQQQERNNDRS